MSNEIKKKSNKTDFLSDLLATTVAVAGVTKADGSLNSCFVEIFQNSKNEIFS